MSRSLLTIAQNKIVKIETTRQAKPFSKPLPYPTMMSYQTKCYIFSQNFKIDNSLFCLEFGLLYFREAVKLAMITFNFKPLQNLFPLAYKNASGCDNTDLAYFFRCELAMSHNDACISCGRF